MSAEHWDWYPTRRATVLGVGSPMLVRCHWCDQHISVIETRYFVTHCPCCGRNYVTGDYVEGAVA